MPHEKQGDLFGNEDEQVLGTTIKSLGGIGILSDADLIELTAGSGRVLNLMGDGEWYTARQIRIAAGKDGAEATEGLRRMRELRKIQGVLIDRRRDGDGRGYSYRLRGAQ